MPSKNGFYSDGYWLDTLAIPSDDNTKVYVYSCQGNTITTNLFSGIVDDYISLGGKVGGKFVRTKATGVTVKAYVDGLPATATLFNESLALWAAYSNGIPRTDTAVVEASVDGSLFGMLFIKGVPPAVNTLMSGNVYLGAGFVYSEETSDTAITSSQRGLPLYAHPINLTVSEYSWVLVGSAYRHYNGVGIYGEWRSKVYANGVLANGFLAAAAIAEVHWIGEGSSTIIGELRSNGMNFKAGLPAAAVVAGKQYGNDGKLVSGLFNNKVYSAGLLFTGTGDGTVGDSGKIYSAGVAFTGTGNGTIGVSGKIYSAGVLFTGTGTPGAAGKVYTDGVFNSAITGTADGTIGTIAGRVYLNGVFFSGTSNGTVGESGKVYSAGSLFTGTGSPGTANKVYVDGVLSSAFTGTGDGANGTVVGKIYSAGVAFTGTGNGTLGVSGKIYSGGSLFNGVGTATLGVNGNAYAAGMPFTGTGAPGVAGKLYVNGVFNSAFTGFGDGTAGTANGKLYYIGILLTGVGDGTVGELDRIYNAGVANTTYTGYGNGVNGGQDGSVYLNGKAYYGNGTGTVGEIGRVYFKGRYFIGTGNGTVGESGKVYSGGVLFNGTGSPGTANKVYKNGVLFTGTGAPGQADHAYTNGDGFTGTGNGTIGVSGKIYKDGALLIGLGNSTTVPGSTTGLMYKDGSPGPGYDSSTKLAYGANGTLFTGISDGTSGPSGWKFANGVGYTGKFDGVDGTMYKDGAPYTGVAVGAYNHTDGSFYRYVDFVNYRGVTGYSNLPYNSVGASMGDISFGIPTASLTETVFTVYINGVAQTQGTFNKVTALSAAWNVLHGLINNWQVITFNKYGVV